MTKEEIEDYFKRVDELGAKLIGEDKETYDWLIYSFNQCAKLLNETEQLCQKQKEYNQHLHNLNNTIFRELLDKKYENKKQKEVIDKINIFLNNHDKNAGKLYYKYNNKYLLSEIKEDIRNILKEVE